jgi:hypothetical protein
MLYDRSGVGRGMGEHKQDDTFVQRLFILCNSIKVVSLNSTNGEV